MPTAALAPQRDRGGGAPVEEVTDAPREVTQRPKLGAKEGLSSAL